ncbi:non-specific lipid transfer protein GPI-anchored 8-like [Dioscorea cayenensis subsp. rotundata]|uniref:Non-specific lipid transfer protein GPI-anchored 8-like n=1 Tax=Dioscorea cayennensis subsp. rotundata TaxID=55577 RepID=A0AB40BHB6_DIOCR|nr:non-specific lipid transfer protein GPI-anchored 8-like [Dioscorea cayenensis subsp. rotundata]
MAAMKFITLVTLISVFSSSTGAYHAAAGGGGDIQQCLQKLMPCEPYLKSTSPPPATCCVPLKDMVAHQPACLCTLYNDDALLKSLNVTKQDTLNMVGNCGAKADTSLCNNGSTPVPPVSPSNPTPSNPAGPSGSGASLGKSLEAVIIMIFSGFVYFVLA